MKKQIKSQIEVLNQQIKELVAVYHSAAGKAGISENEFWIWYALLVLEGEYSQQDICDMWSFPKQTVNTIITNLVKREFIYLETVPGTRNRKVIRLTEEGKRYGGNCVMWIYQAERRSLERMSDDERRMCITLLGKYMNNLKDEVNNE